MNTLFQLPPTAWAPWKTETCCVCGKGFTEASWDEWHTFPYGKNKGGDCHARCCPCKGQ